jgi:site-specific DNA-methyltransferase (adenine-specific)
MELGRFKKNTIYNEDCYKSIKELPDKCIDLILTDPPYEIETQGGNTNIGKSLKKGMCKELDELKITSGVDKKLLYELLRVLKKPNIYIWCNKKQIPDYLDFFVKEHGCSFEIMTWLKSDPTPLCGGNYLIDKEFCLYFRKGVKLNTTFETAKTYWFSNKNVQDKKDFGHPTIKPLEITKILIKNSSNVNDVVLDCFMGSGTTAVACKELDRQYLGFEIDKNYFEIAQDRIKGITKNGQTTIFTNFEQEILDI